MRSSVFPKPEKPSHVEVPSDPTPAPVVNNEDVQVDHDNGNHGNPPAEVITPSPSSVDTPPAPSYTPKDFEVFTRDLQRALGKLFGHEVNLRATDVKQVVDLFQMN